MSAETVRLDISIQIDTEDVVDTGITVADWNAMTDDQRNQIIHDSWMDLAQNDNGGIRILPHDAEGGS